jgi:hypothetical protein
MATRKPNFFIVGAPKCGTSALYHSLLGHPEVFLPYSALPEAYWIQKEPMYFCDDLGIADWLRVSHEEDYLKMFEGAGDAQRVGEASALYLFSPGAPQRIHDFTGGDCRIIIALRPPVDWMRSWHHDCLRYAHENVGNFGKALALEPERELGRRIPASSGFKGCLCYRKEARFAEQVARYFDLFGRDRVKVILLEDMISTPEKVMSDLAAFLKISTGFPLPLERQNDSPNLIPTHLWKFRIRRKLRDYPALERLATPPLNAYRNTMLRFLPPLSDKSIDPELRARLTEEFRPEVDRLSALLGRDLSHWYGSKTPGIAEHLPR